jgi:sugar lactone lactonase YvrE
MIADWRFASCALLLTLGLLAACAAPPPLTPTPTTAPIATATFVPSLTPALTLTPTLISTPTLLSIPTITELAKGFGGPDDLALMPDGTILFSDVGNGTINHIVRDGTVTTLLRGLNEPEGIVVLPDGALIVAEQNKNRLVHFRPNSGQPATTWLQLENKTGKPGVDGIVRDAATSDIIVPDSPNGRVLRVSANAQNVRVIATGLVRPTGAAVERDGSIIVADENGNAVQRVRANGRVESLGHFTMPDDVAIDAAGNIFVASLGDNSIRLIDAHDGAVRLIATLRNPQGIVVDADGNLIVAEYGLNRIVRLKIR